jgi:carboxymethylenebutenolidase
VLEARLAAGKVAYEGHRYDAKHAFYNPGGLGNHHPEHAGTAWKRTLDFFKRNLN